MFKFGEKSNHAFMLPKPKKCLFFILVGFSVTLLEGLQGKLITLDENRSAKALGYPF
jgi:hypothetical protein